MSRPIRLLLALPVAATAAACDGGQVGEENVVCAAVDTTALELDQPSPLGVSAGELVASLGGRFSGELAWADGETSAATVELAYEGGAIEYQERAWMGDGPRPELGGGCEDALVIELRVSLDSDDGRLAESWVAPLVSTSGAAGAVFPEVDGGFSGSLEIEPFAPDGDWDELRALVDVALAPSTATVTISGQASRVDGDIASAQGFPVGELSATRP